MIIRFQRLNRNAKRRSCGESDRILLTGVTGERIILALAAFAQADEGTISMTDAEITAAFGRKRSARAAR